MPRQMAGIWAGVSRDNRGRQYLTTVRQRCRSLHPMNFFHRIVRILSTIALKAGTIHPRMDGSLHRLLLQECPEDFRQ